MSSFSFAGVLYGPICTNTFSLFCSTFVISSLQYLIVKLSHNNYLGLDCVIAVCNFASSYKLVLLGL